ncbi:MAG: FAD-dependent oxidoreductase [Methanobacteriota archaeon]|nr:MAG: FAD-dependent oxidoreductase [Euryarchaeota archaeon]
MSVKSKVKPKLQLAKIIADRRETVDTRTLRLQPSEPFEWQPGQFIMVKAEIDGKTVSRAYSIASSPTRKGYLEITVRETANPTMSKYLNEIPVGYMLAIKGPYGKFIWNENVSDKLFCLAAGSGITPFRAFMQYIIDKDLDTKFKLLYSVRYGNNIIYEKELQELVSQMKNGEYHLTITRDPMGIDYARQGRINEEYLAEQIKGFEDANFYLCGSPSFIEAMKADLLKLGIPPEKVKREQWG